MNRAHAATATRTVAVLTLSVLCACSAGQGDRKSEKKLAKQETKREKEAKREAQTADSGSAQSPLNSDLSRFATTGCDESLWGRVYNPTRLQKLAACVGVSGTVAESAADDDGDQHFLLKLDAGQEGLIDATNAKKKSGDLVVEIVCANPVLLPKVKGTCSGYTNRIAIPAAGAHVKAIGAYVIDSHNGWAEIHPVTKLQRL
jgi:hypothetical protein